MTILKKIFSLLFLTSIPYSKDDLEQAQKQLAEDFRKKDVWDPFGYIVNAKEQQKSLQRILASYIFIKQNPSFLKRARLQYNAIAIILFIVSLYLFSSHVYISSFILALSIFVFITYRSFVYGFTKSLVKLAIARENDYLYFSTKETNLWDKMKQLHPVVFRRGNSNQYVYDLFFGKVNIKGKPCNFIAGLFTYGVTRHRSKGTHTKTYVGNFVMLQNDKKFRKSFSVVSQKAKNVFPFTVIPFKTESLEFNKKFHIYTETKDAESDIGIASVLTPAVVDSIVRLNKETKELIISFADDGLLMHTEGYLLKKMKTKFTKSAEIHPDDKKVIVDKINAIANISGEILEYN
ncbi:MAG: DUF3137 domain-containing protein [Candidatus Woesearchaeota archaeon]